MKELRIQNSSGKGCGNRSITLGENKQGRFPLIHRGPCLSTFSGWVWNLPAVLPEVWLGKWELPRSPPSSPSTPRRSHLSIHLLSNGRNLGGLSQRNGNKASFLWGAPPLLPLTPSSHLHVHCFPDLRFLESACQCRLEPARLGSIPGSGRSPGGGNGNPLPYSCLENPVDRGA